MSRRLIEEPPSRMMAFITKESVLTGHLFAAESRGPPPAIVSYLGARVQPLGPMWFR